MVCRWYFYYGLIVLVALKTKLARQVNYLSLHSHAAGTVTEFSYKNLINSFSFFSIDLADYLGFNSVVALVGEQIHKGTTGHKFHSTPMGAGPNRSWVPTRRSFLTEITKYVG